MGAQLPGPWGLQPPYNHHLERTHQAKRTNPCRSVAAGQSRSLFVLTEEQGPQSLSLLTNGISSHP